MIAWYHAVTTRDRPIARYRNPLAPRSKRWYPIPQLQSLRGRGGQSATFFFAFAVVFAFWPMSRNPLQQRLISIVEPVCQAAGYELVDLRFTLEQCGWTLRVAIDRPIDDSVAPE